MVTKSDGGIRIRGFQNALSALRHRSFRVYWLGQMVSLTGTWMQVMAQGWVVTDLSTDAFVLGLLNVAGSAPILLLSLKGGELADRFEKRKILILTQVAMMLLAFVFASLVYAGRINLFYVFVLAILLGVATAFDLPAAQSMPPELVEPAEIPHAVALMQSIFHGARLVGPAIAGVLIAHFGRGSAFVANGVSFIAVIVTLLMIAPRGGDSTKKPKRAPGGAGISEGFKYIRSDDVARALITLTMLSTALVFPFLAVLMVYYVRRAIGSEDARVLGTLMSASGLGSVIGSMAILSAAGSKRVWLAAVAFGAATAITGLSFVHDLRYVVPLCLLLAFSVSSFMGRISQMIHARVPGEIRGRVMGIYSMTFTGVMPLASMLWSFLADRLGGGAGEGYRLVMRISAGIFVVAVTLVLGRGWKHLAAEQAAH